MADQEVMSTTECWELLGQHAVGRIAFSERTLPAVMPLNYVLVGGLLLLRVRADGLAVRLERQIVAFEIDEIDLAGQVGWSVVVTGQARSVTSGSELARLESAVAPSWAGRRHQTLVSITPGYVQGRRLVPIEEPAT